MSSKVEGEVKIAKFKWEINEDSCRSKVIGDYIRSPVFSSHYCNESKNEWQIRLYPKGKKQDPKGYLAIFLHHLSEGVVSAEFNLSLLNQDGDIIVNRNLNYVFDGKISWGLSHFTLESFITDPKNNVLKNNKFTIMCKIITKESTEINKNEDQCTKNLFRLKQFDDFEKLLTNKGFSDITITAEEKSFYLHKCIISNKSTVFEAMFKTDMTEKNLGAVEIKDTKYNVLQELFRFIYTGKVNEINSLACDLLTVAEKYCVEDLKIFCQEAMVDDLNTENAIEYLISAVINNADKLKKDAINWIALHLECLVNTEEFECLGIQYPELLVQITIKSVTL